MKNTDIRSLIENHKLKHWQIAEAIGVSEFTFCRWLRKEFTADQKELVLSAIAKLTAEVSE